MIFCKTEIFDALHLLYLDTEITFAGFLFALDGIIDELKMRCYATLF